MFYIELLQSITLGAVELKGVEMSELRKLDDCNRFSHSQVPCSINELCRVNSPYFSIEYVDRCDCDGSYFDQAIYIMW